MLRPVFERELAVTARRGRSYALRSAYGLVLIAVFVAGYLQGGRFGDVGSSPEATWTARGVFLDLLLVQGIAVIFLTPALVAGAVAGEVQRKTLGDLLTSDLGSAEIVLGKLAARLMHVGVAIAAGIPPLVFAGLVGGVDPRLVVLAIGATASTAVWLGGLSILGSVLTRSVRGAMNFVFTLALTWLILPASAEAMLPRQGPLGLWLHERLAPVNAWIAPTSPFAFWMEAVRGSLRGPGVLAGRLLWMVGLQLLSGAVLASLAIVCLRPCFRASSGGRRRRAAQGRPRLVRARRARRRVPCGDDPMLWKELFAPATPTFYRSLGLSVALALVGLLAWGTLAFALPALREVWGAGYGVAADGSARLAFHAFLRHVATGVSMVVLLGAASDAAGSMTAERERDTWISLLATPLSGREIVRAKILGALWGARHTAAVFAILVLAGVLAGSVHPLGGLLVVVELASATGFAAALGTWVSLRSSDTMRAVSRTTAGLLLAGGLPALLALPLGALRPMAVSGCPPAMIAASLATYGEVSGLPAPVSRAADPLGLVSRLWLDHGAEMVAAALLGALGYAAAAWALARRAGDRFDALLDRPTLSGNEPPADLARDGAPTTVAPSPTARPRRELGEAVGSAR